MPHRAGRAGHLQDTNGFIKCHFYTALGPHTVKLIKCHLICLPLQRSLQVREKINKDKKQRDDLELQGAGLEEKYTALISGLTHPPAWSC